VSKNTFEKKKLNKNKLNYKGKHNKEKNPKEQAYDRYHVHEPEFWKGKEIEPGAFNIDTRGSYQMTNLPPDVVLTPNPIPERPRPEKSIIRQTPNTSNPPHKPRSSTRSSVFTTTTIPIIIVSAAPTALVTLYNVEPFLLDSVYKISQRTERKDEVEMDRKLPIPLKAPTKYKVVDNIMNIQERDWYRVVAVIAQGQEWQFKAWPKFWATPPEIFSKAKGFYFHFDDERIPDVVNLWNVKILPINKNKRHMDKTAVLNFWKLVDQEVAKRMVNNPTK